MKQLGFEPSLSRSEPWVQPLEVLPSGAGASWALRGSVSWVSPPPPSPLPPLPAPSPGQGRGGVNVDAWMRRALLPTWRGLLILGVCSPHPTPPPLIWLQYPPLTGKSQLFLYKERAGWALVCAGRGGHWGAGLPTAASEDGDTNPLGQQWGSLGEEQGEPAFSPGLDLAPPTVT